MAKKIYRLALKGQRPADEVHRVVGEGGGLVLRVHQERDETHVYYEADDAAPDGRGIAKEHGRPTEVKAADVTKIG